jgi:hypothetical protein
LFLFTLTATACCLLINISSFPLNFFCDEGLHLSEARSLLKTGTDVHGVRWPLFFRATGAYEFGFSVYLQLPFSLILGPTEQSVRIKTAVVCVMLSGVMALILRRARNIDAWSLVPLAIFCSPLFFIIARTGYQAPIAVLLYGIALSAFLAWRATQAEDRSKLLYVAALAALLSAYTYTAARGWVAVTALVLGLLDRRALWERRSEARGPTILFVLGCVPLVQFLLQAPDDFFERLSQLRKEAVTREPLTFMRIIGNVATALSPSFWFGESLQLGFAGGERYRLPGLPYLPRAFSLVALLGLLRLVRHRDRLVAACLVAMVCAGLVPAAFLEIKPLRCFPLWLAVIFLVVLGLGQLLLWAKSARRPGLLRAVVVAALLSLLLYQTHWANHRARDFVGHYGFGGVELGAREAGAWLQAHSSEYLRVYVTPRVFTKPVESLEAFFEDARQRVEVLTLSELCRADFESAFVPFDKMVLITRRPMSELPACGLRYSLQEAIFSPRGVPVLSIIRASLPLGSRPSAKPATTCMGTGPSRRSLGARCPTRGINDVPPVF